MKRVTRESGGVEWLDEDTGMLLLGKIGERYLLNSVSLSADGLRALGEAIADALGMEETPEG